MSTKYLQLIGSNLDSQSNIVTLKVPTLESGATDYTDADKTSVQTAITEIANAKKPVVILDYNGSYMPANYFVSGTHHYFTVIGTDKVVDNSGSLYLVYIDYDESNNTLVIQYDVSLGSGGSDPELVEDVEELKQQVADLMYTPIEFVEITTDPEFSKAGSTLNNVKLSWSTNKAPEALEIKVQRIDGSVATSHPSKIATNMNFAMPMTAGTTFTIIATDERGAITEVTTQVDWINETYCGTIAADQPIDSNFIELNGIYGGFTSHNDRSWSFYANATSENEHAIFAIPSRYGKPTFSTDDGLMGFHLVKTVDITNSLGYTEPYDVWLSDDTEIYATNIDVECVTVDNNGSTSVEIDTSLSVSGMAADAKTAGDRIRDLENLIGDTSVSEQIADAITEVYVQNDDPTDAPEGSIWVDLDEEGLPEAVTKQTANVYVVDAATTDITTVDFSQYTIGDVVLVTSS